MVILCREINKSTGEIAVYSLDMEVTGQLLLVLSLRARLNPELTYYVTTREHYANNRYEITKALEQKTAASKTMSCMGRIVRI